MATLLSNFVWEGLSTEMAGVAGLDGHIYKQLDTGESYMHRDGEWAYINLGLAFVKATKSGVVTTDASGEVSISFNTPFIDDSYSVMLTVEYPGSKKARLPYKGNKTINGFDIIVTDGKGDPISETANVSWLCTRDYNP